MQSSRSNHPAFILHTLGRGLKFVLIWKDTDNPEVNTFHVFIKMSNGIAAKKQKIVPSQVLLKDRHTWKQQKSSYKI